MFSFLKKVGDNRFEKERKIIINAFPRSLENDARYLASILRFKEYLLDTSGKSIVNVNNEEFAIPYRIGFDQISLFRLIFLSEQQKMMLYCIYSRHYNGYIREKMLKKLILSHEKYVIPYIIKLSGEYVIELLEIINNHLNEENLNDYYEFYKTNQSFFKIIDSRMSSYWGEYYRTDECNKFSKYIGKKIINRIKFYSK